MELTFEQLKESVKNNEIVAGVTDTVIEEFFIDSFGALHYHTEKSKKPCKVYPSDMPRYRKFIVSTSKMNLIHSKTEKVDKLLNLLSNRRFEIFYQGEFVDWIEGVFKADTPEQRELEAKVRKTVEIIFEEFI